jgi:hypothetical protein
MLLEPHIWLGSPMWIVDLAKFCQSLVSAIWLTFWLVPLLLVLCGGSGPLGLFLWFWMSETVPVVLEPPVSG